MPHEDNMINELAYNGIHIYKARDLLVGKLYRVVSEGGQWYEGEVKSELENGENVQMTRTPKPTLILVYTNTYTTGLHYPAYSFTTKDGTLTCVVRPEDEGNNRTIWFSPAADLVGIEDLEDFTVHAKYLSVLIEKDVNNVISKYGHIKNTKEEVVAEVAKTVNNTLEIFKSQNLLHGFSVDKGASSPTETKVVYNIQRTPSLEYIQTTIMIDIEEC